MRSGAEKAFIPFKDPNSTTSLENRCRIVVDRLNSINESGRLRYLTWGTDTKNGQYLCSVSQLGAICQDLVLSLVGKKQQGDAVITYLGTPNQDSIRYRDGRAYLGISMLLDPTGSECGVGFELKDDLCQKKPDPPFNPPSPTPSIICPAGWGPTPSGCMPVLCPVGMAPSVNGCVPSVAPSPSPSPPNPSPSHQPSKCPPGMPAFLCILIMPRS